MSHLFRDNVRWIAAGMLLAFLFVLPAAVDFLDETFFISMFSRIMVLAIAALSLNLIMGYGGMISFGHAVYVGIGGYAVGILAYYEVYSGFWQWPVGILGSALFALIFGAISLRTKGVYFIMITLAFAQMAHFLALSLDEYGADDGLNIYVDSEFPVSLGGLGFDLLALDDRTSLYYVIFGIMVLVVLLLHRMVNSRFGMVVRGARSNDERMRAIGYPTYRYRLVAFVVAGAICGIAGLLSANLENFVSPAMMHWTRSAELIFMVVLGGMGSVFGPIWGAFLFWVLRDEVLDAMTLHWAIIFGPFLVIVVLYARSGLDGFFNQVAPERSDDAGPSTPAAAPVARRVAAFFIDLAIVAAGMAAMIFGVIPAIERILSEVFALLAWPSIGTAITEVIVVLLLLATYGIGPLGYHVVMVSSRHRATLGKRLMGLAVVGPGGARVLPRQSFQRLFLQLVPPIVVLLLVGTGLYHLFIAMDFEAVPVASEIGAVWYWAAAALSAVVALGSAALNANGRAWYDGLVLTRVVDAREAADG